LRGHGGSLRRDLVHSKHLADILHKRLIRHSDAYICYTNESKNSLKKITEPEKLFVANNTLDTEKLFEIRKQLEVKGKYNIRKRLGLIKSKYYICYIGRLIKRKEVDLFLQTLHRLQNHNVNVGGVVIGKGPEQEELVKLAHELNLRDVHFTGFIPQWDEAPYLYACDALLNPGYVGLSVNHALSLGLPVITQKRGAKGPFHSREVAFLKESYTGFFSRNSDINDLTEKTLFALKHSDQLRINCIEFAENNLTVEKMIKGHLFAIDYAIEKTA
jgi:glycosyltransferase involved in cell wall biosynthesis